MREVVVVLGTRPEAIKLAGIVRRLGVRARVVSTGQHFDTALWGGVLAQLGFPDPDVALGVGVGGASRAAQIGAATSALGALFDDDRPAAVVVQGDTNAALAGALAANACQIPLVHVEAGLRSHDRAMPEEHNRVVVDHLADLLLAPTEHAAGNLAEEGIPAERVEVTGNTVVEAVLALMPSEAERAVVLRSRDLEPAAFVVATMHRPENVDHEAPLARILDELSSLDCPVVLPLHPRTAARIAAFGLGDRLAHPNLLVTEPLGPIEFLGLAAEAALLVSDSGGVQEEASVLKRPVLVVRRSTERQEVQGTFASLVRPDEIRERARPVLADVGAAHARLAAEPCPYGDGSASERSMVAIDALLRDA